MSGLSVLIPTKNEEENVRRCLESVSQIASEVVVLDSYSEDRTVEICEDYGARVLQREFDGFSKLRKQLLSAATEDWVLFLDADEEMTQEVVTEIQEIITQDKRAAYRIDLRANMFGEWVNELGGNPVRFGPKDAISVEDAVVHESIVPTPAYENNVKNLDGGVYHYTYSSVSNYLDKFNQYTALEALALEEEGKNPGVTRMVGKGLLAGTYDLVFRGGYKAGSVGMLFALMSFLYRVIIYFKQRELKELKSERPDQWRKQWIKLECQRK